MRRFHSLNVAHLRPGASDAVCIGLDVPEALKADFEFEAGQHLAIETDVDGQAVRRTYSICSPPGEWPLEIAVRIQEGGVFSTAVRDRLKVGDPLRVMPPLGRFRANAKPGHRRRCAAFAAGSGITPVLSIIAATLSAEPQSRFLLFYGNRQQDSTMFVDELFALKNRFTDRLQLHFLFRERRRNCRL